ncbi:MAG TPA: hypothetical protein VMV94_03270 [Phycisphaerae bacterium]|nr:hypothetical protein [Phycisphaerae bacterium]
MSQTPTIPDRAGRPVAQNTPGHPAMYEKISPDLRRTIDQAIVDHDPPTYREIHEKFGLAERGISFWVFYRYARNIRCQAEKLHIAELVLPDEPQVLDALPKLLAQRLFQVLLYDETATAREIHQLTYAYRAAAASALAREKFTAARATADKYVKEKQNDDFLGLVNQFLTAANAHTKAHEAHMKKLGEHPAAQPLAAPPPTERAVDLSGNAADVSGRAGPPATCSHRPLQPPPPSCPSWSAPRCRATVATNCHELRAFPPHSAPHLPARPCRQSALRPQRSALSTQHPALRTQHFGLPPPPPLTAAPVSAAADRRRDQRPGGSSAQK